MRNAITVDVEDWFHPEAVRDRFQTDSWGELPPRAHDNCVRLLDIFARAGVRGTFFVLGWVAERDPRIVEAIVAGGHEVASHGYAHQMIGQQGPEAFRADVVRSLEILRAQSGQAVVGYRAPSFSIVNATRWAIDILTDLGIRYDSSIYPVLHDRYGIPGAPRQPHRLVSRTGATLVELPPPTLRLWNRTLPIAGGGTLRLFPYAWSRWAIERMNREGYPAVVYTHPWEYDVHQPRLPMSAYRRWRHYAGIPGMTARLQRLLSDFAFGTCHELIASMEAAPVPDTIPA